MGVGMIEAVREDLVAGLGPRGKIPGKGGLASEFDAASGNHDPLASDIVLPEARQVIRLAGKVKLDLGGLFEFNDKGIPS